MNLKTKLAAALVLMGSVSAAQATTYTVVADFKETMTGGVNTFFEGTFDWDGAVVSAFTGRMNESMRGVYTASGNDYTNYGPYSSFGMPSDTGTSTYWGQVNDLAANNAYMLTLDKNVNGDYEQIGTGSSSAISATVFKENTTDVYTGGGYNYSTSMGGMKQGAMGDGLTPNENAYFTLVFNTDVMGNVITGAFDATTGWANDMEYGDCTVGSLMMAGNACMAGETTGSSMMAATPLMLTISEVSAVPVPAAAWLFGGALMSLFGANRRKNVLPA